MNDLLLDSILVMLVCFVAGAAIAWLLAAALHPTRADIERARRERGRASGRRGLGGDAGQRQDARVRG